MNNRYLYRAKRIDNGEWVEGYLIYDNTEGRYRIVIKLNYSTGTFIYAENAPRVDTNTICQCTGLMDKNRKLIWENDIVRFQFDNDDCPFMNKDTKKRVGKVFFSDFRASWSVAMGRKCSKEINNDLFRYVQNGNRVEVIGNVFENPELLE